jgi:hypothetical protein
MINSISRDISCANAKCGVGRRGCAFSELPELDVAVVLGELQPSRHQRNYATTKQHLYDLPPHDILEPTDNFTI